MKIKILILVIVILVSGCISEPQTMEESVLHNSLSGSFTIPDHLINIEKVNRSIMSDTTNGTNK